MGRTPVLLAVATVAGVALVVLPFLTWYAADLPRGTVTVSGIDASGELWIVPAMGVAVLIGAWVEWRHGPSLAAALTAAVAGAIGAGWSLRNSATVPVRAVVDRASGSAVLDVSVGLAPAAPAAVVAGTLAALASGLIALRIWLAP